MTTCASLLCLLAAASAAPALAAPTAQTEGSNGEILVLGSGLALPPGTPAYSSVTLDREQMQQEASGRLDSILKNVAGFQQFRRSDSRSANPSAQGAGLRALGGNASSRTLLLLDGVPQADPFFGYIPFSALVPDRLSAIRVTRGGGSGPFGAGAVAGTIELFSDTQQDAPLLSGQAFYGSYHASEIEAGLAPHIGEGQLRVSGRWDRGDGFITTPSSQQVAATVPARYNSWSTNARWVMPLSATQEIQINGLIFNDQRVLRFKGADNFSKGQDASIRFLSRGAWQADVVAYVQARDFGNVVISATKFTPTLRQNTTPATGAGGKIELRPPVGGDHVLRLGGDVRLADGRLDEDSLNAVSGAITAHRNAGGRIVTGGVFVEDDWTQGSWVWTAGVRADHWSISNGYFNEATPLGAITTDLHYADRSGWNATARLGSLLTVSPLVQLRGAAYSGFRLPTLNELYRPFTVFPIVTQANADLQSEQLKGAELGADVHLGDHVTLAVTGFYNRLDHAIGNVTIATNVRQRQNLDAIIAQGVELTASAHKGDLHLDASYAYSHSRVRQAGVLNNKRPSQSPADNGSATLGWLPAKALGGSVTVRYVGAQFEDDLETDRLPPAVTVDAVVRLPLKNGMTIIGRVENMFDKTVITRNAGGSIDTGTPQLFWLGVKLAY